MPETRYYNPRYVDGTAAPKLRPETRRLAGPEIIESPKTAPRKLAIAKPLFYIAIAAALIASCLFLLSVRSDISSTGRQIITLQSELQTLRTDNDAKEVYLNKSIDLTEIYNVATGELGMVYPSDENVIFYHRSDGGYVRQYEQIPTN